jgi:uncharacterized cysteine cluster protein YcgN (CxxCxxCC family)
LDTETGKCKVYEKRFDEKPTCKAIEWMVKNRTVPVECEYVEDKEAYKSIKDRRHYHFNIVIDE